MLLLWNRLQREQMIHEYRVVHAPRQGAQLELSLGKVFVHYSHFCEGFVKHCSSVLGLKATCHADRFKDNGLVVSMDSTLDEVSLHNILAVFVNETNYDAPGLSLKIEPVTIDYVDSMF